MAERSQSQEWMWSVLDECAEQGVFPQANEATLRFLDIVGRQPRADVAGCSVRLIPSACVAAFCVGDG